MQITKIKPTPPTYDIAERYCAHMEANVILARINEDATKPPEYMCLSSHLCKGNDDKYSCRHKRTQEAAPKENTGAT